VSRYFAQNELIIIRDNGWIVGLVTPHEVKEVERWPSTTVDAVMRPLNQLCAPETPVTEALETIGPQDMKSQLSVVSDGRLEGVISCGNVVQFLQVTSEKTRSARGQCAA
jgi:predicted transcriptional regulator